MTARSPAAGPEMVALPRQLLLAAKSLTALFAFCLGAALAFALFSPRGVPDARAPRSQQGHPSRTAKAAGRQAGREGPRSARPKTSPERRQGRTVR